MQKPAHPDYPPTLGARYLGDRTCQFRVWAPKVERVDLRLLGGSPRLLPMERRPHGYFELRVEDVEPGTGYFYRLDGQHDRPDPASRLQPQGVHRESAVVDPSFPWTDQAWSGLPLHEYIIYELHVGTFSRQATFDGVIEQLDTLQQLGVTALELMPLAQFPGSRNWGYDGVHPFAVQNSYGGPEGLKRLVDACHAHGLAVIVDVVYNHVGPEGNYLGQFGHYFTGRHRTPWGDAINFDDRDSDEVRRFVIENALYWLDEYHVDALRLDAVHAIFDFSARPILQELATAVRLEGQRLGRQVFTIAESSLNDPRLIRTREQGGYGLDSQWCDDFHHAIRITLTSDHAGYYEDYREFADLVKAFEDGFVIDGRHSQYRGRRHGAPSSDVPPRRFVVCSQNHDQIGNRMLGERLSDLVSWEQNKLAAATVLLSPYQPMLFMGEEYGETAPFLYFISHTDPDLVEAVRNGRREEFRRFRWSQDPPDPQSEETFHRCQLNHALRNSEPHRSLWEYYRELIAIRRSETPLALADRSRMQVEGRNDQRVLIVRRWSADRDTYTLLHYGSEPASVTFRLPEGTWMRRFDSADPRWTGEQAAEPSAAGQPEPLESTGQVTLQLPPWNAVLLVR